MGAGQRMQEALESQYERGRKAGLLDALVILDLEKTHGIPGRAAWLDALTRKLEVRLLEIGRETK